MDCFGISMWGHFFACDSEIVTTEVSKAPPEVLTKYYELLALEPEFVPYNKEATDLADRYVNERIISNKFLDDAL